MKIIIYNDDNGGNNNNNSYNNSNNNSNSNFFTIINFIVPYKMIIIQFHSLKTSKHSLSQDFS